MKITVNNRQYNILPIPIEFTPHTTFFAELLMRQPKTVEEANQISKEIAQIVTIVLAQIVKPQPSEEDKTELWNYATHYTAELIKKRTEFFRKHKKSSDTKSRRTRVNP